MAERLTALDATFLELEQSDQGAHMHIGGILVFDPRPDGSGVPSYDEICARLEPRIRSLPHFCDRLSSLEATGVHWPEWVADDRFDLRGHIRHATLPAPGGVEELQEWAADYYSQRLDRSRPLWEMAVLDGLTDGRWAIVTKTHHAMVDGVGSIDIGNLLLDTDPDGGQKQAPILGAAEPASAMPADRSLLDRAAELVRDGARVATAPVRLAREVAGAARDPDKARDALRRARAALKLLIEDELIAAPDSSINQEIGAKRRLAYVRADLDDLKLIKRELGGTINDVVLTSMAAGLRKLLLDRGEQPPEVGLRAMVPVNSRQDSDDPALGNKITSLFVHLPVAATDTATRYARQVGEAESLKSSDQALGSTTVVDLASHAPPAIHSFLARSLFATRLFNVTITNVPDPQQPLYALGARMREAWPLVPLAAEHQLGLAVLSYDGSLFYCLNADRDSTPDLGRVAEGIEAELVALGALARERGEPTPPRHAELQEVGAG